MRHPFRALAAGAAAALAAAVAARAELDPDKITQVEALRRLKDSPSAASPAVQGAVARVLAKVRGEPEFVGLVRDFHIEGREEDLLSFAAGHPGAPAAADAVRLLLDNPRASTLFATALHGSPESVVALLQALGAAQDNRTVPLAAPLSGADAPAPVRRAAAKALTHSKDGAAVLIAAAREGKLPEDVKLMVGSELRGARWPEIRQAAGELFPAPKTKNPEGLPPLSRLLRMPADAARGAAVFRRADVGCITCHQVNGEGVDFGPKLSEIGAKLGKDALAESVLDPSAGIAFGYELWNIALKSGDEVSGLVASETEAEIALKAPGGVVTRYPKADIARREKQALSAMPAGLQEAMTTQDFADLLEYLSSLKRATP